MVRSRGSAVVGVALVALAAILAPAALAGRGSSITDGGPGASGATGSASGGLIASLWPAHAARMVNITDTAKLHYTGGSGSLLHESGTATGGLPGRMQAECNIGAALTTTFTIYATGGTITGHGKATPHGSGTYESFSGTIVATGGTGRYAHAHGSARLYGVFDRKNYALTVQTTGKLTY